LKIANKVLIGDSGEGAERNPFHPTSIHPPPVLSPLPSHPHIPVSSLPAACLLSLAVVETRQSPYHPTPFTTPLTPSLPLLNQENRL
ncbi:unnamed protein product, partial [Closterium sp. Naga37s-1]